MPNNPPPDLDQAKSAESLEGRFARATLKKEDAAAELNHAMDELDKAEAAGANSEESVGWRERVRSLDQKLQVVEREAAQADKALAEARQASTAPPAEPAETRGSLASETAPASEPPRSGNALREKVDKLEPRPNMDEAINADGRRIHTEVKSDPKALDDAFHYDHDPKRYYNTQGAEEISKDIQGRYQADLEAGKSNLSRSAEINQSSGGTGQSVRTSAASEPAQVSSTVGEAVSSPVKPVSSALSTGAPGAGGAGAADNAAGAGKNAAGTVARDVASAAGDGAGSWLEGLGETVVTKGKGLVSGLLSPHGVEGLARGSVYGLALGLEGDGGPAEARARLEAELEADDRKSIDDRREAAANELIAGPGKMDAAAEPEPPAFLGPYAPVVDGGFSHEVNSSVYDPSAYEQGQQ
jgi:hypothetical protein